MSEPVSVVTTFLDALAAGDSRSALDLLDVDIEWRNTGLPTLRGRRATGALIGMEKRGVGFGYTMHAAAAEGDVASIAEVVRRRFRRYLAETADEPAPTEGSGEVAPGDTVRTGIDPETGRPKKFAYPPNLLVVDGAKPQVDAASAELAGLGITDVAVCGLAKRLEEVWLPHDTDPVILSRTSEGLYLLQRIRDEAHRFAITNHRQRRSQGMTASALDGVPGLGPARKQALLKHFGSVRKLRAADVDDAVAIANSTRFGLGGIVFGADEDAALRVARRVDTGSIGINFFASNHHAPFGGRHDSGLGLEYGIEGLAAYLTPQSVHRVVRRGRGGSGSSRPRGGCAGRRSMTADSRGTSRGRTGSWASAHRGRRTPPTRHSIATP